MSFEHEKRLARDLLSALEDGRRDPYEIRHLYEAADPALVHLIFGWLRARYPASHSASDGVLGRMVTLLQESPTVARRAREGAKDPIVAWFEENYADGELDRDAFLDTVVEKLEG